MSQGWSKIFNRINWLNRPSTNTPLNATNLNAGDSAIDKLDDRIITLDTVKADMQVVNGMVADISVNDADGVITVTYKNGSTKTYDTNLEKIATNFTYDYSTQRLVLTLSDGSKQYVDMSALITQYEFKDSTTIALSVDSTGKVSATVKNGSITDAMLETGYLAKITAQATKAESASEQAQSSETASDYNAKLSQSYAVGGAGIRDGENTDNAKYYSEQAKAISESLAKGYVTGVKGNEEKIYRRGDVNLTCDNIGALAIDGDSQDVTTTFTSNDSLNELDSTPPELVTSGETHKSLFSKISTTIKNVRWLLSKMGETDISTLGDGTVTGALSTLNSNIKDIDGKYIAGRFVVKGNETATSPAIPNKYNGLRLYYYDGNNALRQSVIIPIVSCNIPYMTIGGIKYVSISVNSNRTIKFTNNNTINFVITHMYAVVIST